MLWWGAVTEGATKKLRSNIRRSTETGIAVEMRSRVTRQGSRESTDGSTNSNSSDGTCVQPTRPCSLPSSVPLVTEPGAGWEDLPGWVPSQVSGFLCVPASLRPPLLGPGPQSSYCSRLLHPIGIPPVAQELFILSVCFTSPTSQPLHT